LQSEASTKTEKKAASADLNLETSFSEQLTPMGENQEKGKKLE